jgi:type IV secretory pathway VirB10-like protein
MVFRRRRPLMRTAAVAGTAYGAYKVGQNVQDNRQQQADMQAQIDDLQAQQEQSQQYAPPPPQYQQAPPQYQQAPPMQPAEADRQQLYDQLKQLGDLHAQGILSDDEFEQEKKRLLGD